MAVSDSFLWFAYIRARSTNEDIYMYRYHRNVISILAKTTLTNINIILKLIYYILSVHFNSGMLTESAIFCKNRALMFVTLYSFSDW